MNRERRSVYGWGAVAVAAPGMAVVIAWWALPSPGLVKEDPEALLERFHYCDPPWPLGLVFPASSIVHEAWPRIPPAQIVAVLRALGDDTRLRALRLIAERPRSTQELAPLAGVTGAALSMHFR